METSLGLCPARRAAFGAWILLVLPVFSLQAFSQETSEPVPPVAPVVSEPSDTTPAEESVDLHTLVLREQSERADGASALSVRGTSDGTVEVRDASGNLIQTYPLSRFRLGQSVQ